MKENEIKEEAAVKLPPLSLADMQEVIDTKFLQTEAYIDAQCKGSYKKNQNRKAITGVEWKKNQKQKQIGCSVKSRNGQQEEQCWSWE